MNYTLHLFDADGESKTHVLASETLEQAKEEIAVLLSDEKFDWVESFGVTDSEGDSVVL